MYSKAAQTLRPYLLAAFEGQGASDQEKEALALIKDWDLTMKVDSAPAAVFEMFFARLFTETLVDDLGEELTQAFLRNHYAAVRSLPGWAGRRLLPLRRPGDQGQERGPGRYHPAVLPQGRSGNGKDPG